MMYSVWVPATRKYDYYATAASDAGTPAPKHLRASKPISSHAAGWPLPSGARPVGSGDAPKGMIATKGGKLGLGGLSDLTPWTPLAAGATAAYLVKGSLVKKMIVWAIVANVSRLVLK